MYWLGVTTLSLTQGSSICSMSVGLGSRAGLSMTTLPRPSVEHDVVLDRRRRRDEVDPELALEPLLDDLHVEQAEEAAAEAEPERDGALGLVRERGVVEVELLERLAEQRVVLAADRVDAGEDEALRLLVAGQRLRGRAGDGRDGVADLGLADVLQSGRDVADLAGDQLLDGHELRPEDAELERLGFRTRRHQPDLLVLAERALGEPDVHDHALVRVVVAVEDQALERLRGIALRGRDPLDDRFEDLRDAGPILGRGEDHLLARDRQHVLELLDDRVRVGRRQVDLVEHRDERQALAHREMDVGEGLGLDALGGVDDEDRTLAGLQAVAHFVREVDVTGRVDEVEPIGLAVTGRVFQADGPRLDRDPLLALEVHRVEDLAHHLPALDGVGQLEQPIGEGRLAVVDVGDDREVAQSGLGYRLGQLSPRPVESGGAWSCCRA